MPRLATVASAPTVPGTGCTSWKTLLHREWEKPLGADTARHRATCQGKGSCARGVHAAGRRQSTRRENGRPHDARTAVQTRVGQKQAVATTTNHANAGQVQTASPGEPSVLCGGPRDDGAHQQTRRGHHQRSRTERRLGTARATQPKRATAGLTAAPTTPNTSSGGSSSKTERLAGGRRLAGDGGRPAPPDSENLLNDQTTPTNHQPVHAFKGKSARAGCTAKQSARRTAAPRRRAAAAAGTAAAWKRAHAGATGVGGRAGGEAGRRGRCWRHRGRTLALAGGANAEERH